MKEKWSGSTGMKVLMGLVCGALSFALDFLVIPNLSMGTLDQLWSFMVILCPTVLALVLFRPLGYESFVYVLFGLPVQYALFYLLGDALAGVVPAGFDPAACAHWPINVTLVQCCALFLVGKMDRQ